MENIQAVIEDTIINGLVEDVAEKELDTVIIEGINDDEVSENKISQLNKIIKPKSNDKSRTKSANGVCTIVNSKKNGKRVTFSKDVMELFDNPESLEIGFTADGIVLAKKLPENGVEFRVKKIGNKGVIYSSSLVQEITELFVLDFSDKVAITFVDAEELEVTEDSSVFEIKVIKN